MTTTEEKKQAALEAAKTAVAKATAEATAKTGWNLWTKIAYIAIATIAAAASAWLLNSCSALGGTSVTLSSPTYGSLTVTLPVAGASVEQAKEAVAEASAPVTPTQTR